MRLFLKLRFGYDYIKFLQNEYELTLITGGMLSGNLISYSLIYIINHKNSVLALKGFTFVVLIQYLKVYIKI